MIMITGRKSWIIGEYDRDDTAIAFFGPFPSENEADAWEGTPGGPSGYYRVHALYSPPQWIEHDLTAIDPQEDAVHDGEEE
jgi:hypothetical protein